VYSYGQVYQQNSGESRQGGLEPMRQIRKSAQTKSVPIMGHFYILNQMMVHHIDLSWNTIEPSLTLMYQKLVELKMGESHDFNMKGYYDWSSARHGSTPKLM
jgi:hypothetical protein